ncbi:MAG: flippase [bacterium]
MKTKYNLFLKKFYQFRQHKTIKNITYLTFGNIIAQFLSLIGAFCIPKLLGPGKYGIFSVVTAYVGFFSVFTFNGLNKIIIREIAKDISKTKEIFESTIGIKIIFSILSSILAISVVLFVSYELGTKIYIIIFSFSLMYTGFESSLSAIFQSHQKMKIIANLAIIQQLIRIPLSIFVLKIGYGVLSLIFIQLFTQILSLLILYKYSLKIVDFRIIEKLKVNKEYLLVGARFTLLSFLNVLSGRVDILMLSFLTTPENVGIYSLAYRLVKKGLIIRGPISQSLFPYYSEKYSHQKPNLKYLLKHSLFIILILSIIFFPAILFIKPLIFYIIGKDYIYSAVIFKVLVFYLIFNFTVIPWGLALQTTSNEIYSLITLCFIGPLNIILNLFLFKLYGIIGIAYSTLIVEMLRLSLLIFFTTRIINK